MPIKATTKLRAPRVFVMQVPVGMRYRSRESIVTSLSILGITSGAGGADLGGSTWRGDESSRWGGVEGKAGSSILSWLSIAGTLFGIGESETDREVVLLGWEVGGEESKEPDDELR